jgi:cytosine/adenosine deaminase-related metal-dependent hydrolase
VERAVSVAASWVLPIAGPTVARGWVSAQQGRIAAVGGGRPPEGTRDLGDVVLLPGLVNTHTHLELSWMAGRVPPADTMSTWIRALLALRRSGPTGGEGELQTALRASLSTMRAAGTVLVGDISNTLASVEAFADTAMAATVFHEILGFDAADPVGIVREAHSRLREVPCHSAVVGHAPYSTSPELFRQIAAHHQGPAPLAVHLAESNDEMELLHTGQGPMRELLEALDVWHDTWVPPGRHPVRYLRDLGYLPPGTLLVHGVHLSPDDIEDARRARAVIVTCPRSNVWVGGGVPPIARFYASGIDVAIGTDSLASVESLNVFDELAALRRLAPEVEAVRLLESATRIGAEALGHGADYGTLAPGRVAQMVAVTLPSGLTRAGDVEEYLVSGVPTSAISLVDLSLS